MALRIGQLKRSKTTNLAIAETSLAYRRHNHFDLFADCLILQWNAHTTNSGQRTCWKPRGLHSGSLVQSRKIAQNITAGMYMFVRWYATFNNRCHYFRHLYKRPRFMTYSQSGALHFTASEVSADEITAPISPHRTTPPAKFTAFALHRRQITPPCKSPP